MLAGVGMHMFRSVSVRSSVKSEDEYDSLGCEKDEIAFLKSLKVLSMDFFLIQDYLLSRNLFLV